jgi:hypothetical protein
MGRYLGKEEIVNPEAIGVFIPIVLFVMLFSFLSVSVWVVGRRKEREAFYRSETLRRITEASGEGAKAAIELMREDDRLKRVKAREGMKITGLLCIAVGIGCMALFLTHKVDVVVSGFPFLGGLIPGLVGVAMLIYVYFMAAPVE